MIIQNKGRKKIGEIYLYCCVSRERDSDFVVLLREKAQERLR